MKNKSILVAHRGLQINYPENTLPAMLAAVQSGCRFVECDIQFSKDRIPFLMHDVSLRRTCNLEIEIFDLTSHELATYSAHEPDRFGDNHYPTAIPTLSQLIEKLNDYPDVTVFVELKRQSLTKFGFQLVVEVVLTELKKARHKWVIISFDYEVLKYLKEQTKAFIGWVLRNYETATREAVNQLKPDYLFIEDIHIMSLKEKLWQGNWQWVVYDVMNPAEVKSYLEKGVSLIESSDAKAMLEELNNQLP